jgi:hypothetical protein
MMKGGKYEAASCDDTRPGVPLVGLADPRKNGSTGTMFSFAKGSFLATVWLPPMRRSNASSRHSLSSPSRQSLRWRGPTATIGKRWFGDCGEVPRRPDTPSDSGRRLQPAAGSSKSPSGRGHEADEGALTTPQRPSTSPLQATFTDGCISVAVISAISG